MPTYRIIILEEFLIIICKFRGDKSMGKRFKILIAASLIISTALLSSCMSIITNDNISKEASSGKKVEQNEDENKKDEPNTQDQIEKQEPPKEEVKLVPYEGVVEHIFFHPLIAYPELAFKGNQAKGYNDYFVTIKEFNLIIDSLYKKGFILVDINSVYETVEENGKKVTKRAKLMLPEGKKPIVLSIDDLNYYKYMLKNGNVYKLILDSEGNIATYSKNPKGEDVISYDNEIIPILDKFVEEHPDFSLNGAKGTIALTGYEGILGYRTDFDSPNHDSERAEALKIVKRLKETGWTFASHSYGHFDAPKVTYDKFVRDTDKWKKEVESLTGPTQIYIYPFGSRVLPGDKKFDYLLKSGFKILCAVGPTSYEKILPNAVMTDRRHIDGIGLHSQRNLFLDLFDSNEIIDSVRPDTY